MMLVTCSLHPVTLGQTWNDDMWNCSSSEGVRGGGGGGGIINITLGDDVGDM